MGLFGFGKSKDTIHETSNRNQMPQENKDAEAGRSVLSRFWKGLTKTRNTVSNQVDDLVKNTQVIDDDFYESLLDILIMSDIGVKVSERIIDDLRVQIEREKLSDANKAKSILKDLLKKEMAMPRGELRWPMVMLIVGVNGVGKTTTIGKLALRFKNARHSVVMVAADTFRAAAAEQLSIWAERAGVPIIHHAEGADPAAVVFDGIQKAKSTEADLLLVDTAGRLHNKRNLMEELRKIAKIIDREYPEACIRTLLVLDATTGQNGLQQAKQFAEVCSLNGIILTKLDGTAKGGIAIAIKEELQLPVLYVGMGEGIDDLQAFDADAFIDSIL